MPVSGPSFHDRHCIAPIHPPTLEKPAPRSSSSSVAAAGAAAVRAEVKKAAPPPFSLCLPATPTTVHPPAPWPCKTAPTILHRQVGRSPVDATHHAPIHVGPVRQHPPHSAHVAAVRSTPEADVPPLRSPRTAPPTHTSAARPTHSRAPITLSARTLATAPILAAPATASISCIPATPTCSHLPPQ